MYLRNDGCYKMLSMLICHFSIEISLNKLKSELETFVTFLLVQLEFEFNFNLFVGTDVIVSVIVGQKD